jgi:hypothetical protein
MKAAAVGSLLILGSGLPSVVFGQGPDPNVAREIRPVRVEVARSLLALRQYTWTEHTEVLVKGKVSSTSEAICRYNSAGELVRRPAGEAEQKERAYGGSNRPVVRKKAEMQDYIERAISVIRAYIPPKPEHFDYLVGKGFASLGRSDGGRPEIRFKNYFRENDSLIFTYDAQSKTLLRARVESDMGNAKDPVTLDVVFEKLPDGVNRVVSSTLDAKAKKVRIITRNVMYQKLAN